MNPEELLNEIFTKRTVEDESGNIHTLTSNIDRKEGEFLYNIIKKYKPQRTIEIGCAMGISSLYIGAALNEQPIKQLTIIDPMQSSDWGNIGVTNLKKSGIDFYELIEQPSEIALPALLSKNQQFDLGFIDGWHTFDHTLLDFFYMNRLINVGGIIIIDDVTFPGIRKLMRYILNYPAYELIGVVNVEPARSLRSYLYESTLPFIFRMLSKFLPKRMRHKFFTSNVLDYKKTKYLKSSMIALQKIKEDDRRWDWFVDF